MKLLEVKHLAKSFGDLEVLKDIHLKVDKGEVITIIGPSGSGKSTLLRCINQLETPTSGEIIYKNQNMLEKGADIRKFREEVGMVFQKFNLFPMKTVLDNVTLAPVLTKHKSKAEAREYAMELLKKVGLESKADAKPAMLSGGQQQRVAIARTLVLNPDILLFDEPMSALDVATRLTLRKELKQIQEDFGTTMIYITHDQEEAFAMSDRIMVMRQANIVQIDTPEQIISTPADAYIKEFVLDNIQMKIDSLLQHMKR